MTTTTTLPEHTAPDPIDLDRPDLDREAALTAWVDEIGRAVAPHTARHDADGTFVTEAFDLLRSSGYLALGVPVELGGRGATIREVALANRVLARHCASTALASSMHNHVVLFTAWRHRRGLPGAEATLRRVAEEGIILVSTGGADLTRPRGQAVPTDGGYLVSGRKIFASQSPVGTVMSTMFALDDPEDGPLVLNMSVPLGADGVEVLDTWDALGMRGTGSNEIDLTDVFVPEDRVLARRPVGVIDPPLQIIMTIAISTVTSVYLGVAEGARDAALEAVRGTSKADDPLVQRQVGLMQSRLQVAAWALDGVLTLAGDDPTPSLETALAVMAAKREVALAGIEVCDIAMDLAGGGAFFKGSPIERAYRDIRAVKFHPLQLEESLQRTGQLALGLPADLR
jgi:alkylation response protein AidB-like acyl-CoA dehydrogenase